MTRPLRIEYNGAWYHVMNRGLERRLIFRNDSDKELFLEILAESSSTYSIEIHAFSLMDNHYHLLIHTPQGGLGRAMRHINGVYTQLFNKKHRRDGPIFRGRYNAKLVDENEYLIELIRYIHRNPQEAKLCSSPKEHPWTSHRYYLKKNPRLAWLHTDRLLEVFADKSKNKRLTKKRFADFISKKVPKDIQQEINKVSLNIIGSQGFKEWAVSNRQKPFHKKTKSIAKSQKKVARLQKPSQILKDVAFMHNKKLTELKNDSYRNESRIEAAYFLRTILGLEHKHIAKATGLRNENGVSQAIHRVKKRMQEDKAYLKMIREKLHYLNRK